VIRCTNNKREITWRAREESNS